MNLHISKVEEIEHSKYLLHALLPFLKRLNDEQLIEMEIEARRQGILSSRQTCVIRIRWKGLEKASWVSHVPNVEAKDEVCHKSLNC